MKEHNYASQNANTRPRLQRRTQNICFVISISAVILKRMVKITSIFGSYRVLKNSMAWHFLTFTSLSSKLEFVYPPCCGVEEQMLIFSSGLTCLDKSNALELIEIHIPKLTIVLIWKTPACLKFGKTSKRAVENLLQRNLWVWAANDANFPVVLFDLFVAQCTLVKCNALW